MIGLTTLNEWIAPVSALLVSGLAMYLSNRYFQSVRLKTDSIRAANRYLGQYYIYARRFAADPASPAGAKEILNDMQLFFSDRDAATILARLIRERRKNGPLNSEGSSVLAIDQVEKLAASRLDLAQDFWRAVSNGMNATMHRWPDLFLDEIDSAPAVEPRREITVVAVAKRDLRSRNHNEKPVLV